MLIPVFARAAARVRSWHDALLNKARAAVGVHLRPVRDADAGPPSGPG